MEVELRSSWQDIQVELLKSLHGFEVTDVNEELGSVDYVAEAGDEGRRLLRVMVDGQFKAGTAGMKAVERTLEDLEGGAYDEAILMAEGFTSASKVAVMKEENLGYISPAASTTRSRSSSRASRDRPRGSARSSAAISRPARTNAKGTSTAGTPAWSGS